MSVELTSDELKEVLQDNEVQALIIEKLKAKKTEGLADALTAQYKSLGIISDGTESASAGDSTDDQSSETGTASSADPAA